MGKHTDTIHGLRFQKDNSDGCVHIHDNSRGIRFEMPEAKFKTEVQGALDDLATAKQGAVRIEGKTAVRLYLIKGKNGRIYSVIVRDNDEKQLRSFIRSL